MPMVHAHSSSSSPRKPTNLTVRIDLLAKARELGLNLSSLLEQRLIEAIHEKRQEVWLAENEQALNAYNARVLEAGVFSDKLRRF